MKVGYIAQNIWDNREKALDLDLIAALVARVDGVKVFTQAEGEEYPPIRSVKSEYRGAEFFTISGRKRSRALYPLEKLVKWPLMERKFFTNVIALRGFIKENPDLDILQVESAYPWGFITMFSALGIQVPFVAAVHTHDNLNTGFTHHDIKDNARMRFYLDRVYKNAAGVRALSPLVKRWLVATGAPKDRIRPIPLNLDRKFLGFPKGEVAAFKAAAKREVAARHGLREDARIVISLCRLVPMKGLEYLIKAARHILAEEPETVIMIAGGTRHVPGIGDYAEHLRRVAAGAGVEEKIVFTGGIPHDRVRDYLAASEVCTVPSVVETLNMVIPEAATAATPSVVTETTGISHWVNSYGSGVVVKNLDPEDLAAGILRILKDPALAARMGDAALRMKDEFLPEAIAKSLVSWYEELLGEPSHPQSGEQGP